MACILATRIRGVRWAGFVAVMVVMLVEIATLGLAVRGIEQAAGAHRAFAMQPVQGTVERSASGPFRDPTGTRANLRDWEAVTDAMLEVAQRVGADEIQVVGDTPLADVARWPDGWLRGRVRPRWPASALFLPLERETVYLLPADLHPTAVLEHPSSTTTIVTSAGADTGARLVTLRPRLAVDWLSRVRAVATSRFADGSAVVGIVADRTPDRQVDLTLYWELPAAADGRPLAEWAQVMVSASGQEVWAEIALPPVTARRSGELTVTGTVLQNAPEVSGGSTLRVSLVDGTGRPIRAAAGAEAVEVPLGASAR